jgi:hypothetical protein
MKAAHLVRVWFSSFSDALKMAWALFRMKFSQSPTPVTFTKSCGDIRKATVQGLHYWCPVKGFARFSELNADGEIQYRSFRFERVKF